MKKGFYALTGILLSFISITQAQDSTDSLLLNEIIIKENRISYPFSKSSRNVTLISKKDIMDQPAISIPEILTISPGLDIRQRGPAGVQADIGIQGGTFEQTLVLLNGIKLSDPQTGHHALNVPIMFDNLERIEILKGDGARRYGQNAYAGAVNFITAVPDSNRVHARVYAGDFASYGGNVSVSNRREMHGHYLSFGLNSSDGYQYNTDYTISNGFYQGEVKLGENSKLDIIGGLTNRKFGANGFYASAAATDQYEEIRTGLASIALSQEKDRLKLTNRISWRNNRDNYSFIRDNPGVYNNVHTTNTFAYESHASWVSEMGTTGMGIELRKETINGDWKRGGVDSKSNLDGFSRENAGIFLEHRYQSPNGRFDISPGVYVGWYSDFGTQFFPGIEGGFQLNEFWKIYGNVGKAFRIPTFYDQYYESPVEQGNPELKPEEAWTYEAGLRFLKFNLSGEVNAFYRDNQNLIDWVLSADEVWEAKNFTEVQTKGVSMNITYSMPRNSNPTAIESLRIGYTKIDQENRSENEVSRYALEHLSDQFITTATVRLYKKLVTTINFRAINRVEQDPYTLLDAKVSWDAKRYDIFIEATNIGNTSYSEVMTTMPGRWFRGGFSIEIPY